MNSFFGFAKAFIFMWLASAPVISWAAGGYLFDVVGSVTIVADKNAPHPALRNHPIISGTTIRTGDRSYAILKFEDGLVASVQSNSTFKVRTYHYDPKNIKNSNIAFSLLKGGVSITSGLIGKYNKEAFRLALPNSTIKTRGTKFLAVVDKKSNYVKVLSGGVDMVNAKGQAEFTSGQTVLTSSATSRPASIPSSSVPTGTFNQLAAISETRTAVKPVAAPVAAPVAKPVAAKVAAPVAAPVVAPVSVPIATPFRVAQGRLPRNDENVIFGSTPGGAAMGGAAIAPIFPPAPAGLSSSAIAWGAGAAVLVSVAVKGKPTTQH